MPWTFPFSRILLPWIIAWVIVFPLIHIHPDIDHAHGASNHTHGGTFHSVVSEDLPCETQSIPPHHGPSNHPSSQSSSFTAGPSHHVEHLEFVFTVLTHSKTSSKQIKFHTNNFHPERDLTFLGPQHVELSLFYFGSPPQHSFSPTIFSRPPPASLS